MDKNLNTLRYLILLIGLLASQWMQAEDLVFTPTHASHGLSDNQIRYILQLPDGRMVFTTSGNLNLYDGARFTYIHRLPGHIYPLSKYDGHYHIYQDGDSLLWIKDRLRLMCVDLRREQYADSPETHLKARGVNEPVGDFFMDTESRIWLLTSRGLLQPDSSLLVDLLRDVKLQDLATEGDRLYLFYHTGEVVCHELSTGKPLYTSAAYPTSEQSRFGGTSLVIKGQDGFYQLRNGSRGGFFYFDPRSRIWNKLLESDRHLNTLIITPEEKAYISCTQGIWEIDPRTGEQRYLPTLKTVDGQTVSTEISTIFRDRQGGLWVGTLNRGLLYYHPARYKFTQVSRSFFPVPLEKDLIVSAFAEDKQRNIYLRCGSEVYMYVSQVDMHAQLRPVPFISLSAEVQRKLTENGQVPEYNGHGYTALCTDSRGWTWAGTPDGLTLFLPDTPSPRMFYTEDGLINNFVHAILEDRAHRIWVTTSCGISQIQVDAASRQVRFVNYNAYDGTLEGEYADRAAFEASDGTLYFGGIDGFNVLHPANLTSMPAESFHPVFTALRLRGEEIRPGQEYDGRLILSQAAPYTRELSFAYNQNFLTFEFSALNYLNRAQTCYRYRLKGVDPDWRETTTGEQESAINPTLDGILRASYTNLPAGKYTLQVMASDGSRRWDGTVTELDITILAPWWRTTTAYVLYALLLLMLLAASIYLYIYMTKKKLERQHKEEILLLRIRNLIEQCNQYEEGQKAHEAENACQVIQEPSAAQDPADALFLSRAMEQVEKSLDTPGYSVEQLSRDLCMDRTGLYRKLIALLDESPSLFIRNIRLRRAAQLLQEGNLSIAEITERVGFSTSSYLSKCFQEMYGCRPSEYADRNKKST